MAEDEARASVDNGAWDGNAAMVAAGAADDPAAAFAAICAGRRAGDRSLRQTWALPHHRHPGDPPNADGVRNSLSRLPQTQGLVNRSAAQAHLDAHLAVIQNAAGRAEDEPDLPHLRENLVRASEPLAFRADGEPSDGRLGTIVGTLVNYGQWYEVDSRLEGRFMERVMPGAFAKTFAENRSRMQIIFDHGQDRAIGRKPLGPLEDVQDNSQRLVYSGALLDTSYNRDLAPGLRAGVYGSSHLFSIPNRDGESWNFRPKPSPENPEALPERTIREARIKELGPTPFPTAIGTSASMRSLTDDYFKRAIEGEEPADDGAEDEPHSATPPDDGAESAHSEPVAPAPESRATPTPKARVSDEDWLAYLKEQT